MSANGKDKEEHNGSLTGLSSAHEKKRRLGKEECCPVDTATHYLVVFSPGNSCSFEEMDLKSVASTKHLWCLFDC